MMVESPHATNVSHWSTQLAIVTDWHDGPREGVCALEHPTREFWFELVDERTTDEGLDDRLFAISDLPLGTVNSLVEELNALGSPPSRIWALKWKTKDGLVLGKLDQELHEMRKRAMLPGAVILTSDMLKYRGYWDLAVHTKTIENWFDFLSL